MGFGLTPYKKTKLVEKALVEYPEQVREMMDLQNPINQKVPAHAMGIFLDSYFRARKIEMARTAQFTRRIITGTVSAVHICEGIPPPKVVVDGRELNPSEASFENIIEEMITVSKSKFIDVLINEVVKKKTNQTLESFCQDDLLTPEQIRLRLDPHDYANQRPEYVNRTLSNVIMVDHLPVEGKSIGEMALGFLSLLAQPNIFAYLNSGYTAPMASDNPIQLFVWNLRWQAKRSPDDVGAFLRSADVNNTYIPRIEAALKSGREKIVNKSIGQAVLHVLPGIGELHQKINPISDIGMSPWRDILLEPLQKAALGKKLGKTPKLREIANLLEGVNAGYLIIRKHYYPVLEKLRRFDAASLIYFLDHTLPLALLSYNVLYKPGMSVDLHKKVLSMKWIMAIIRRRRNYDKAYPLLLALRDHLTNNHPDVARVFCEHANAHDDAMIEALIGRITPLAEASMGTEDATNKIFLSMYGRSDGLATQAKEAYLTETKRKTWERNIENLGRHAAFLIATLIRNMVEAKSPEMVEQKSDKKKIIPRLWKVPAFGSLAKTPNPNKQYAADVIGPPCYTFETSSPPGNEVNCARCKHVALNPVHLLCGHMVCTLCEQKHGTRCDVLEEYLRRRSKEIIDHLSQKAKNIPTWTVATLGQDLYKVTDSSPKEKIDIDEEDEEFEVLDPPDIQELLAKIPKFVRK